MRPPGCWYRPNVVTDPDALFTAMCDEVPWTRQMRSRLTASMGVPYNYSGARYPVADWHPAVDALRHEFAPALGFLATNCLLNRYPDGRHTLGWHADDVDILQPGTGIGILSLGVARIMRLRTKVREAFEYEDLLLEPGSLLYMSAEMQTDWKHALKRSDTDRPRISLSFRHIVKWTSEPEPMKPRWGED